MLGLRALSVAAGLCAARAQNVYQTISDACREDDGGAMCSGSACQSQFDVLTDSTAAKCNEVCGVLDKTCTGYQFGGERCEIWKVPIMGSATSSSMCYNRTDDLGAADGDLYLYFEAEVTGLNYTAVMALPATAQMAAANAIKGALASVLAGKGVMVQLSDIKVNFTDDSVDMGIINSQSDKRLPLRMYRLLHDGQNEPNDGLTTAVPAFTQLLTNNYTTALRLAMVLDNPTPSDLNVSISDRMLSTTEPTEAGITPTTTTVVSSNNQGSVGAAHAHGPEVVPVCGCLVLLFSWLGSSLSQ